MPLNITHAEDSYLLGKVKFERFLMETAMRFIAPEIESQLMMTLDSVPEEMRAMVDPNALARLELLNQKE